MTLVSTAASDRVLADDVKILASRRYGPLSTKKPVHMQKLRVLVLQTRLC
jgi:hypothetical protein